MRDYKHVRVPKRDRSWAAQTTVRRVSTGRETREQRRRQGGSFVRFFAVLLTAAVLYGGWLAYRWFTTAEIFVVTAIDVKGVKELTEKEIRAFVSVFEGQNVFLVDLDEPARRASAHPWVKDVRIHRRLPNRISMVITERVPAAVLDTGKAPYLIDAEGYVIEKTAKREGMAASMPAILARAPAARPGEQAGGGVTAALAVLRELTERGGWRMAGVTVKADTAESLTIRYEGHEIRIGSGNYAEKLRRLAEISADMSRRGRDFVYVDLRPERQAAAKLKN
jgi:cell division protein FtsQ